MAGSAAPQLSKEWDEATTEAAIETAEYVVHHINELAGTNGSARRPRQETAGVLPASSSSELVRRPLKPEEMKLFVDKQFDATKDLDIAVKRVALVTLSSPQFLYREIGGAADGYNVASRLSYGLWDSLPDQELLNAAASEYNLRPRSKLAGKRSGCSAMCGRRTSSRGTDDVAQGRRRPRHRQRLGQVSRLRCSRDRRFAHVAGIVFERGALVGQVGFSTAISGRLCLPERPIGEVLRRQVAGQRRFEHRGFHQGYRSTP